MGLWRRSEERRPVLPRAERARLVARRGRCRPMSLKHVVKERRYRERSQPAARAHRGLLEKKKDYVLRARDFHKKEDALRLLQEKALFRNPDEFYTGMVHSRVEGGAQAPCGAGRRARAHVVQEGRGGYLAMKSATEAKRADRLRATLHGVDAPRTNKRTVFVDDAAHAARLDADLGPEARRRWPSARRPAAQSNTRGECVRLQSSARPSSGASGRQLGERLQQLGVERALQGKAPPTTRQRRGHATATSGARSANDSDTRFEQHTPSPE